MTTARESVDGAGSDAWTLTALERLAHVEAQVARIGREHDPAVVERWRGLNHEHQRIFEQLQLSFHLDEHGDYWLLLRGRRLLFLGHRGRARLPLGAPLEGDVRLIHQHRDAAR